MRTARLSDSTFAAASLGLQRFTRELYNARSPEIAEAAKVLRRSIARTLSVRGNSTHSAPGSPPFRQSGQLAKSVAQGVVNEGRRIAIFAFFAEFQELGINAPLVRRSAKSRRAVKGVLSIAPRPFLQRSIDLAMPDMVGVLATIGGDHIATIVGAP